MVHRIPRLQHMRLPRAIGSHEHIEPRAKLKFGIGENGKIAEVQAL